MTTVPASLHHAPAGTSRCRHRTTVTPPSAEAVAMPPIVPKSHCQAQQSRPSLDDGRQPTFNNAGASIPRRSCCPIKSP